MKTPLDPKHAMTRSNLEVNFWRAPACVGGYTRPSHYILHPELWSAGTSMAGFLLPTLGLAILYFLGVTRSPLRNSNGRMHTSDVPSVPSAPLPS